MALLLGVAFFAVPFVEIVVILEIGMRIGWDATITLLVIMSAGGAWLVKHEGPQAWRRVQDGLRQGRMPTSDVVDAFLMLVAGVLLLCPGFITSALGLLLLLPPVRRRARSMTGDWLRARVTQRVRTVGSRFTDGFAAGQASQSTRGPTWTEQPRAAPHDSTGDRRSYRRPDDPDEEPAEPRVWGARVRTDATEDVDVIDVDGEEILFGQGELGPSGF